jgi:hypothetical protein
MEVIARLRMVCGNSFYSWEDCVLPCEGLKSWLRDNKIVVII